MEIRKKVIVKETEEPYIFGKYDSRRGPKFEEEKTLLEEYYKQEKNKKEYTPKNGDNVIARRRIKSKIFNNIIIGPVIETWDNACRITTNPNTEIESDFQLFFSDWTFEKID